MNIDQDKIIRVYTALSAIRNNVGSMKLDIVSDTYINEYHDILEKLKNMHIEVADFYISDSHRKEYSFHPGEKYVERAYFLTKVDSLLGYFEIITSSEPKKMGFKKPED